MKASRAILTAVALAVGGASQAQNVVADSACPRYAVDMAAFATCDGDRVASAPAHAADGLSEWEWISAAQVSSEKRSLLGYHLNARGAYSLKSADPAGVVLVDVRSRLEAGLTGQLRLADLHVPFEEIALPLTWDEQTTGWVLEANRDFVAELRRQLRQRGATTETSVILICRSGERSARAADVLAGAGYSMVITVVDGFEGDVGPDGRRSVNGWKNAGLPWTARGDRVAYAGARPH